MKQLSVMIKPASGLCNMRCEYCFYADITRRRSLPNYGIMSVETGRKIVDSILADLHPGDRLILAFQGGEPTLAGIDFFREIFAYAEEKRDKVNVEYALQTNGFSLDETWCELLKKYPVLVGLSLDGSAQLHDSNRKDAKNSGTFRRIMQSKALLDKHKIPYNVLTVLTNNAARHPGMMWNFLVKEGIDYVQFIPCLDELGDKEKTPYALTPQRFYSFYAAIFPLWAKLLREGRYISVKLFDDLVNFYLKGIPTACGINGHCAVQFVVEGDGSVFPCDFYVLDEFCMGNIADSTPGALFQTGRSFIESGRGYEHDAPCAGCKYLKSCGGGCKRMRDEMYVSGGVCYYAKLLDEILPPLIHIGRALSQE